MIRSVSSLIFAGLIGFLAIALLWPGFNLASIVFADGVRGVLTGYNVKAIINTLALGGSVATVATVLGFVVAFALTQTKVPGKPVLRALYLAPLFGPSIMPALGLIYLVGSNGLIFQWELYGPLGVFLASLIFALPHAILQLTVSLETFDSRLINAAKSLNANAWRCFTTVIIPHVRGALINAFLITFVLTITDFGVPKLLGGGFPMLATEIYSLAIENQEFASSTVLCLGLLLPSILAYYLSFKLKGKQKKQVGTQVLEERWNAFEKVMATLGWAIVLLEVATIAIVIYGSFVTFWPYQMTFTMENYSTQSSVYGLDPWVNSLILAISVATVGTICAFLGAYLCQRMQTVPRGEKRLYEVFCSLPFCIPGTVLGLGFALTFNGLTWFDGVIGGFFLLIFNTVVHLYTVSHLTATSTLTQINSQYETVGLSLGISRLRTVSRVILPLSASGMLEVFNYLFSSAITTISAVVFLYNSKTILAAIAAIQLIDSGFISNGSALCSLIFGSALMMRAITLILLSNKK